MALKNANSALYLMLYKSNGIHEMARQDLRWETSGVFSFDSKCGRTKDTTNDPKGAFTFVSGILSSAQPRLCRASLPPPIESAATIY